MPPKKVINILQWFFGSAMIASIALFFYISLRQNFAMIVFTTMIIIVAVILKISSAKKFVQNENNNYSGYIAGYLSEIAAITVIFIMASIEWHNFGIVGNWFYAVLGGVLIFRPLFFWILKKIETKD